MRACAICEAEIPGGAATCQACGAPAGERAGSGEKLECKICGEALWSMAEICVHCGAHGYPALRPKLGDKSEGAPEDWAAQ